MAKKIASKNGKRHYSAATMAALRKRGKELAQKYGSKKRTGRKSAKRS